MSQRKSYSPIVSRVGILFPFVATLLALISVAEGAGSTTNCSAITVYAPQSHYPPQPQYDFLKLFEEDAPWEKAASHIDIMQFSTQFFVAVPDAILSRIIANIQARKIGLGIAVELGQTSSQGESECGSISGEFARKLATQVIDKLRRVGGSLSYISLLGPFDDGYYKENYRSCPTDLSSLGKRIAGITRLYVDAFPSVIVSDTEPFPSTARHADWREAYVKWSGIFETAVGKPIDYLQIDLNWRDTFLGSYEGYNSYKSGIVGLVEDVSSVAKLANLRTGIIVNGKSDAKSDAEWSNQARRNISMVLSSSAIINQFVFQSWHKYPFKSLPENDHSSMTSIVNDVMGHCGKRN